MSGHNAEGHARYVPPHRHEPHKPWGWRKQVRKWPKISTTADFPQRCAGPDCSNEWNWEDHPNHKYCSRACEGRARRVRDAIVNMVERSRRCANCGADITKRRTDARYCGKACLRRGQRLRKKLLAERDGMSVPDIPLLASALTWQDRDEAIRQIQAYSEISAQIGRL